jgi:hypothetical protein
LEPFLRCLERGPLEMISETSPFQLVAIAGLIFCEGLSDMEGHARD